MSDRPLIDAAAKAVTSGSVAALEDALLRYLNSYAGHVPDSRDVMVGLAPFYDAAMRLEVSPRAIFDHAVAGTAGELTELVRGFGARTDITLVAFGWAYDESGSDARYVALP
ncbi:MAG: hypothetical protein QOH73_1929 [Gaiellaceae bacterium]|jgi:hypothetical protein|nr:hypothetical protein [Gaiellaceae bacterium]